jgi:acyl-CoA thioester hydrolase
MPPPYTVRATPAATDFDRHEHLNNVAYVKLVQDVAAAHWYAVAPLDMAVGLSWFVRRHEIDYLKPVRPGDELEVVTWVGEPTAATWERFVEVRCGEQVMARARSVWVLVDAPTGRPRRIDARLRALFG